MFNASHAQVRIKPGTASGSLESMSSRGQLSSSQSPRQNSPYGNDSIPYSDTSATKGLEFREEIPDSLLRSKVFFFHYSPRDVKINQVWNPTLDPTGVQFSNPLDGFNGNFYLSKGILGHPHTTLFPSFADGLAYCLQGDEMEGYAKTPENIRLCQTLTPYTVLSYNNSLYKDYLVHVAHTQNVMPGWNLSFDYLLNCPEGVLSGSGAKNHFLDFTTNYFSVDSRLQVQAGVVWQSFDIDENGGLAYDSLFTDNIMGNFAGLPVRLSGAGSSHLRHDIFGRLTYNMVRQVERYRERDSLAVRDNSTQQLNDSTIQQLNNSTILDTLVVIDTLRVGTPRILNAGVFGVEARYHRQKRAAYLPAFSDSTLWSETSASLFWTNDAYPDHRWQNPLKITLGITPRRLNAVLHNDPLSAHDTLLAAAALNPFFKAELKLWDASLTLEGELDNTLLSLNPAINKPDYHGQALLSIPLDSTGQSALELSASAQRQMPELRMLLTTGFSMPPLLSQCYGIHLSHTSNNAWIRLVDLDVHASRLSHQVWYDSTFAVHQGSQSLWVAQAALTLQLAWKWLHLDMQQLLQHSTDKVQVNVPLWASKNSLYGDFTLFKGALRLQIGADFRYFTSFCPDSYDPATGLFYMQDEEVGDYLWADIFLNLQVKRASIYLKGGHLNALWENQPRYFLLPHYPGQKFALFWGLTWHFFD